MTHTACLLLMLETTLKRTSKQQSNCLHRTRPKRVPGTFLSFLFGTYVSLIEANSDPPLRCLLLLLLLLLPGQFVSSSSETSHLSHSPGGEEDPRRDHQTCPELPCDGPAECLVTVRAEEGSSVPLRVQQSAGCRSASSRGGGLTLLPHSGTPRKLGFLSS